jgi:hypothetical protein
MPYINPLTGDTSTYYSTFSGADILASITVPVLTNDPVNGNNTVITQPVTIGNLQTISVSSHRDKFPVRAFGRTSPKGFTRGPRTIAGSLIFTMFDRESLTEVQAKVAAFYKSAHAIYTTAYGNSTISSLVPTLAADELPPFDITITLINDRGVASVARILGVEIVDNGQVMGIDDLFIEETMSYTAREYYPMYPINPGVIVSSPNRRQ